MDLSRDDVVRICVTTFYSFYLGEKSLGGGKVEEFEPELAKLVSNHPAVRLLVECMRKGLEAQAATPLFGFDRAYEGNFLATLVLGMVVGQALLRQEQAVEGCVM